MCENISNLDKIVEFCLKNVLILNENNLNYNKKYSLAVKLIEDGYLIHCTNAIFNDFNSDFIKGGMRAKEGYGFYFTDMPYKALDYGEIFKLIKKDDFNFLNSSDNINTKLFFNDDIEIEIAQLNYQLDNCRNNREYNYIINEIEKLKEKSKQFNANLSFYIKDAIKNGAKTYGNLEYLIRNPKTTIPQLIQTYINNGYDGYYTDGIYTVFNISKLNKYAIKNSDEIIQNYINSLTNESIKTNKINSTKTNKTNIIVESLYNEIINEMISPVV